MHERIRELEEEIKKTPYNKATQKHIARLKARIAYLKNKAESASGGKGRVTSVRKSGDSTVLLIGPPSVGKSSLLNRLTSAGSKVADYEFTTLKVIPGMMNYNGAKIQVLDVPGLIADASSGKGRGKEILSFARAADLLCVMVDATRDPAHQVERIKKELYKAGFRLDENPPEIKLQKKNSGGLNIGLTRKSRLPPETVKEILREFSIHSADVVIRGKPTEDQIIDFLAGNRVYTKSLIIINKIDLLKTTPQWKIGNSILISALKGTGLNLLKKKIWEKLQLLRIFMKKAGKEPDLSQPIVMKKGSVIKDICERIHKEIPERFEFAKIWGKSAKFPGQKVGISHKVEDKDIVELHLNR
jgi:hypothetical protein